MWLTIWAKQIFSPDTDRNRLINVNTNVDYSLLLNDRLIQIIHVKIFHDKMSRMSGLFLSPSKLTLSNTSMCFML